jgi:hypothetical protein
MTHLRSGCGAVNSRWSTLGATGRLGFACVVTTRLRRLLCVARMLCRRISRATRLRLQVKPRLSSSLCMRGLP